LPPDAEVWLYVDSTRKCDNAALASGWEDNQFSPKNDLDVVIS
jgi:hypothetical protein